MRRSQPLTSLRPSILGGPIAPALAVAVALALALAAGPLAAQSDIPRTPDGKPDLQGNWTNATMTPIVRPNGVGLVLTPDQVTALEEGRQDFIAQDYEISDPDREAPPEGGELTGNAIFDAATGGTGGYNQFFVDAGDNIAVINGEPRSSLIVEPANGRPPSYSEEGRRRLRERAEWDSLLRMDVRRLDESPIHGRMWEGRGSGVPMRMIRTSCTISVRIMM